MARPPAKKILASVLSKARQVALATQEHPGAPSTSVKRRPLPATAQSEQGPREKVIAALKRLHPMD